MLLGFRYYHWRLSVRRVSDENFGLLTKLMIYSYVNEISQQVPTIEYIPPRGDGQPIGLNFLLNSLPANLYALTWLLPSGNLFLQATYATSIYDWQNNVCSLYSMVVRM